MWIANIVVSVPLGFPVVYEFVHHLDDDSRNLLDDNYSIVATIDSSCNFYSEGKWLGKLSGYKDTWKFFPNDDFKEPVLFWDTGVEVQDHHWKRLEEAEIATLKHLIETGVINGN